MFFLGLFYSVGGFVSPAFTFAMARRGHGLGARVTAVDTDTD
jgi:hypothetical protein